MNEVPKELADYARHNFKKEQVYPVFFLGSYDQYHPIKYRSFLNGVSSLITLDLLKPLDEDWDELSSKTSGPRFKLAITEARLMLSGKEEDEVIVQAKTSEKQKRLKAHTSKSVIVNENIKEADLPTNAFIEIDPETGEQTIKKRRGRPPKKRPDDLPAVQYKESRKKEKTRSGTKEKKFYKLSKVTGLRRKLQKILLRPTPRSKEMQIAQDIIGALFERKRCSLQQVEQSKIGLVLVQAMRRGKAWAAYPEMIKSFRTVLNGWKTLPE